MRGGVVFTLWFRRRLPIFSVQGPWTSNSPIMIDIHIMSQQTYLLHTAHYTLLACTLVCRDWSNINVELLASFFPERILSVVGRRVSVCIRRHLERGFYFVAPSKLEARLRSE